MNQKKIGLSGKMRAPGPAREGPVGAPRISKTRSTPSLPRTPRAPSLGLNSPDSGQIHVLKISGHQIRLDAKTQSRHDFPTRKNTIIPNETFNCIKKTRKKIKK